MVRQVTTESELRSALTEGVVFRVGDVEWAPVECGDFFGNVIEEFARWLR